MDREELDNILEKAGLSIEKWKTKFRELGLYGETQLQWAVQEESILKSQTEYSWEKNAIHALFSDLKHKSLQCAEASPIKSGDQLQEEFFKAPHMAYDSLESKDKPADTLVKCNAQEDSLSRHRDVLEKGHALEREKKTYGELVCQIGGGRVLRGIRRNERNCFDECGIVLAPPKCADLCVYMPSQMYESNIVEINSKSESWMYEATKQQFGCNAAASISASDFGIKGSKAFNYDRKNKDGSSSENHDDEIYYELVKYVSIPLKCCQIDLFALQFSNGATLMLRQISGKLSENDTYSAGRLVLDFYRIYGTHINIAKIHFGGTYEWKTTYKADAKKQSTDYKTETTDALKAAVEFSSSWTSIKAAARLEMSKLDRFTSNSSISSSSSKIKTRVTKHGGPPECNNLQEWTEGLVKYQSLWTIVDFGHPDDVMPIYMIVTNPGALPSTIENKEELRDMLKLYLINTAKVLADFDV